MLLVVFFFFTTLMIGSRLKVKERKSNTILIFAFLACSWSLDAVSSPRKDRSQAKCGAVWPTGRLQAALGVFLSLG